MHNLKNSSPRHPGRLFCISYLSSGQFHDMERIQPEFWRISDKCSKFSNQTSSFKASVFSNGCLYDSWKMKVFVMCWMMDFVEWVRVSSMSPEGNSRIFCCLLWESPRYIGHTALEHNSSLHSMWTLYGHSCLPVEYLLFFSTCLALLSWRSSFKTWRYIKLEKNLFQRGLCRYYWCLYTPEC